MSRIGESRRHGTGSLGTSVTWAAHQAGVYASGTGYRELIHQYTAVLTPGQLPEDAINRRQLRDGGEIASAVDC